MRNKIDNVATFDAAVIGNDGTATFEWVVREEHVRQYPYQLVVQAVGSESADAFASFALFRFRTADFMVSSEEPYKERYSDNQVYPNPASAYFFVETDLDYPLEYVLVDFKGATLRKGVLVKRNEKIEVKTLANGYYYLQLLAKNGSTAQIRVLVIKPSKE